jgi:hypothetical protein
MPKRIILSARHLALTAVLSSAAAAGGFGAGCGSTPDSQFTGDGGEAGTKPRGDAGKLDGGVSSLGGDAKAAAFVISPSSPVLTVSKANTTLKFRVTTTGSSTPLTASWSIDAPELGSIDSNGLFTASGLSGGSTTVTAVTSGGTATTTLTVKLALVSNPGMVAAAVQKQLQAGAAADAATSPPIPGVAPDAAIPPLPGEVDASADPSIVGTGFTWLYPYDGTVFPRGLPEPIVQFSGAAADVVYVHMSLPMADYQGYFPTVANGQADIGLAAWQALTASAAPGDSLKVEVTKITAGVVAGPITERWTIAQGSLKGTVYYNSYNSQLFASGGASNGGILKLKPGTQAVPLIGGANSSDCTVCHAVSSDGSTLIATHDTDTGYTAGTSYDLKNNAAPIWQQPDSEFTFGGIYPDGTFLMTSGVDPTANIPGEYSYGANSRLITTNGGTVIAAPGWDGVLSFALSPSFSPDGTKLAFTHYDLNQDSHTIAVMDFAAGSHTFSNLVDVATDPTYYLAWPTFTPDNEWVVFHADTGADLATWTGDNANLVIAHVASKTTANLDVLNGFKNGQSYVPYGIDDLNHNYEPTMLPVAVGGYYWVVFTSRRNYGNTIEGTDPWSGTPPRKKLWVAALDIDAAGHPSTSAHDISHPAFYLDGQELAAGNSRGFWALDPCQGTGTGCQTGDECCTGFCRAGTVTSDAGAGDAAGGASDAGGLVCVSAPQGCSQEFEKCTSSADCCGSSQGYSCINSHCAAPGPK